MAQQVVIYAAADRSSPSTSASPPKASSRRGLDVPTFELSAARPIGSGRHFRLGRGRAARTPLGPSRWRRTHTCPSSSRRWAKARCSACHCGVRRGDHRRRQAGGSAEELLERRRGVAARHARQVQQRQHLGDWGALAAPGRDDHRREPLTFTGHLLEAAVIDAESPDLDPASRRGDGARLGATVTPHEAVALVLELVSEGAT
jgi:hypothetical protein